MSLLTRDRIIQELTRIKNFTEMEADSEKDTLEESEINALWHLNDVLKDVIQLMQYEGRVDAEKRKYEEFNIEKEKLKLLLSL